MWPVFVSLVVLCWTGVAQSSLDCPWNQFHLGRINNKIILLLENMNQKCAWELRRYKFRLAFSQLKKYLDNRRKPNSSNEQ
ncbi:unnamed protein product [Lota lota]